MRIAGAMAIVLGLLSAAAVGAETIPGAVHYQGYIENSGGPVNGQVLIVFRIMDAATAGALLYSETQKVSVASGSFVADIGSVRAIPPDLFPSHPATWLELVVDNETLSPRERMVSVPYALAAAHAVRADVAKALEGGSPAPNVVSTAINASFFAHRNGVNQTIGTSGEVKIQWTTEDFDTDGAMNLTNHRFEAPADGFYHFTAEAYFDPPGAPKDDPAFLAKIVLIRNGTERIAVHVVRFRKGAAQSLSVSRTVELTTGDTVDVYLSNGHLGAATLSGNKYQTYFSGYLLHQ